AAVDALLSLGYPYALEVAPEDLEHLREQRRLGGPSRWRGLVSGLVWPVSAVQMGLALTDHGASRFSEAFQSFGTTGALTANAVHVGTTLAAASGVAMTRPGSWARTVFVAALAM